MRVELDILDRPQRRVSAGHSYYIAPNGTDKGRCGLRHPCATLWYVSKPQCHMFKGNKWQVQPGETIVVERGKYVTQNTYASCPWTDKQTNETWLASDLVGTPDKPIIIQIEPGAEIQRGPAASDASQKSPLVELLNSSYIVWDGGTVVGMRGRSDWNPANRSNYFGEFEIDVAQARFGAGLIVQNVTVEHTFLTCIKTGVEGLLLRQDTAIDCGVPGFNQNHAMYLANSHITVIGCSADGSYGYGIQAFQTGKPVNDETYLYNSVENAANVGLYSNGVGLIAFGNTAFHNGIGIQAAGPAALTQNIVYDNRIAGMSLVGGSTGAFTVLNNTFYRNGSEEIGSAGGSTLTGIFENNIFYGSRAGAKTLNGTFLPTTVVDYNDYYNITPPSPAGLNSLTADPLFMNPANGTFRLRTKPDLSPAVNGGTDVGLPGMGPLIDMGARQTRKDGQVG